jgi:hypothetical protein
MVEQHLELISDPDKYFSNTKQTALRFHVLRMILGLGSKYSKENKRLTVII